MRFLTSTTGLPRRKKKNVQNALDEHEEYQKLKALVLSGKMRPHETAGILIGPEDKEKLGHKFPWRSATDTLRKLIQSLRLESEYEVRKWETDNPGVWFVSVTYEPPMAKTGTAQPTAEPKPRLGRPKKAAVA